MVSGEDLSAAEWRMRLDADRARNPPTEGREIPGELRQAFRRLTQLTRQLPRAAWWEQGALQGIRLRWRQGLLLSQLLVEEFQRPDPASTEVLAALLEENRRRLVDVQRQLGLCELVHESAEAAHPLLEQIVYGREASLRPIRQLAEEFEQELAAQHARIALVPAEAAWLTQSLEEAGWSRPEWFVQGILSARLIAELSQRAADFDREVRLLLIVAGFAQDLGTWHDVREKIADRELLLRRTLATTSRGGRRRADPNHPAMGAALLDGLRDGSSTLSSWVATHHERIDGAGFPRRLKQDRLSREAQWIGLVARFVELIIDPLSGDLSVEQGASLTLETALRLWREVRRGAFEERLTLALFDGLELGLGDRVREHFGSRQRRAVDVRHAVPAPAGWTADDAGPREGLRADPAAADAALGPPVFFRRRRDGQRRGLARASTDELPRE